MERTRKFALLLSKEGLLNKQTRMLHFAPERGLEASIRPILGTKYVTTDLYMKGVDRIEDITRMSFESNSFDLIYCSNVLEHIDDDRAAMLELFRVLAPNGQAYIQVPIQGDHTYEDTEIREESERYKHFGQGDHVRLYGKDIEQRLQSAGFTTFAFYPLDLIAASTFECERMNLGRPELMFRCVKP